jgi:miniconductance mechanosensitive channel
MASYADVKLISKYIKSKIVENKLHNEKHQIIENSLPINGLHTTNLTVFRKYIQAYLEHHSSINKDLLVLCRQLQPTAQGVPIELYAYLSITNFEQHEHIVAEIMEHILASVIYFDLQLYEQPAGKSILD